MAQTDTDATDPIGSAAAAPLPEPTHDYAGLDARQRIILLISILIVALCGITYELIIGTVSSYLIGNSVYQFSLTIGFFMFAMGVGSLLTKLLDDRLIRNFILVEMVLALVGGACSLLLFMAFPLVHALYNTVMFGLILMIGVLVGLEIPILTTILAQRTGTRDSIAEVLSLDYLGALIGSVAFPLFLLPQLGLVRSSFVIGLINALTALVNIYYFRDRLPDARQLAMAAMAVVMTLIGFTAAGTFLSSYAEKNLYFDQVIYEKQTRYQHMVFTQSHNRGDLRLFLDGHIQFSTRDEYRYHEALVHPVMSLPGPRAKVLLLGGGDGMAAREILKYTDVEQIDLVDIDPEITRLGASFALLTRQNGDSLKDPRVQVFNQDAFTFINQPGSRYDRVIIDLPDPHNEALNKLYSREFYTMIRRRMAPQGVLITQSSSPFFTRHTFWCIENTLAAVFPTTHSFHMTVPSFGIWGFNMARSGGAIPEQFSINVPTRYLDTEVMRAAAVFGRDIAQVDSPVNTIMEPKLYQLYLSDLSL